MFNVMYTQTKADVANDNNRACISVNEFGLLVKVYNLYIYNPWVLDER